VPRVSNVNFSISVGTSVPETVRVVEVSPVLIEIHPEWRGHMYFRFLARGYHNWGNGTVACCGTLALQRLKKQ
jgi:hypothetical protein